MQLATTRSRQLECLCRLMRPVRGFSTVHPIHQRLKTRLHDAVVGDLQRDTPKKPASPYDEVAKRDLYKAGDMLSELISTYFDQNIHQILQKSPDFNIRHGLVFRFLGTSVDRIRNSYLVSEDIEKQLKKGNLSQAVTIARLARENGSVGMNKILQFLVDRPDYDKNSVSPLAHKIHRTLKKWGVPDNSHTFSILYDSHGIKGKKDGVERLLSQYRKTIEDLDSKDPTITVNANTTLASLGKLGPKAAVSEILEFYDDIPKPDKVTYTTMFNIIARRPEAQKYRDQLWKDVLEAASSSKRDSLQMDSQLLRSYLLSVLKSPSVDASQQALAECLKYLDIDAKLLSATEDELEASKNGGIDGQKFPVGRPELSIVLQSLRNLKRYNEAIALFERHTVDAMEDPALIYVHSQCIGKAHDTQRALKLAVSEGRLSAETYANLIRAFVPAKPGPSKCQSLIAQLDSVDTIVKLSQGESRASMLLPVLHAYTDMFNAIYCAGHDVPGAFDRVQGLRALKQIALSNRVVLAELAKGNHGPVRDTVESISVLFNKLGRKSWSNVIGDWIYKTKKAHKYLIETLDQDAERAARDYKTQMDAVVDLMKSGKTGSGKTGSSRKSEVSKGPARV